MTTDTIPHNGRQTSILAALSAVPAAARHRAQILGLILSAGPAGLTREEIEVRSGLAGNTVRPRCVELMASGLIRATDGTRVTRSGRKAEILVGVTP